MLSLRIMNFQLFMNEFIKETYLTATIFLDKFIIRPNFHNAFEARKDTIYRCEKKLFR